MTMTGLSGGDVEAGPLRGTRPTTFDHVDRVPRSGPGDAVPRSGPADGEGQIPAQALQVEVIADYATFVSMEAEWNDAVDRAGIGHPFLTHDWLRTWWDCFAGTRRLHIIVVRDREQIVAIAPLMRETVLMYGLPIRKVDLIHNDHTPRIDFIVSDRADDAYQAIWNTVVRNRDWDLLQLSPLPRDSRTRD